MAGDADPAELSLALRSNKRPSCQSSPWLAAPPASAARHLHRAVTTDATPATRYTHTCRSTISLMKAGMSFSNSSVRFFSRS
jgi:hypothetical protein